MDKGEVSLALLKEIIVVLARRGLLNKSDARELAGVHRDAAILADEMDVEAEFKEIELLILENAQNA